MFARTTLFRCDPAALGESLRHDRDEVLPIARQIPGFRGQLVFANHQSGESLTVAMYKDAASLIAAANTGSELRRMSVAVSDAEVLAVARYQLMLGEVRFGALNQSSDPQDDVAHLAFDTSHDLIPD